MSTQVGRALCHGASLASLFAAALFSPPSYGQLGARPGVMVTSRGAPAYDFQIDVPPGIAGVQPNVGLSYSGSTGAKNGSLGVGWALSGQSHIARCPATKDTDGIRRDVTYGPNDKLCLDGQRLIQTDASGAVLGSGAYDQAKIASQIGDAKGLGVSQGDGTVREYRTETDGYVRIRAYGNVSSNANNGPAYFMVWTKDGQVLEYGSSPGGAASNAQVLAQGKTAVAAWALSRRSDLKGNYVDYKYEVRDVSWGSVLVTGATAPAGREWNLAEIQYTGNGAQAPTNKVVFTYTDKLDYGATSGKLQDRSEAYQQGSRTVGIRLLQSIATYVNSPNPAVLGPDTNAVLVKRFSLAYDNGPVTNRSRLKKITECAGASGTACLPPTVFGYSDGGSEAYVASTNFNLSTGNYIDVMEFSAHPRYGPLVSLADFNGDGKTDILDQTSGKLWFSNGDGSFRLAANFNLGSLPMKPGMYYQIGRYDHTGGLSCNIMFVADINGDGLPDIFWAPNNTPASDGFGTCSTTAVPTIHFNNGDGSFRSVPVNAPGAILARVDPQLVYLAPPVSGINQTNYYSKGYNFYVFDVNGDGIADIVTTFTHFPGGGVVRNTHVFLGDGSGNFSEVATNYAAKTVFSNNTPWSAGPLVDFNGDGQLDIAPGTLPIYAEGIGVGSAWPSLAPVWVLNYAAGSLGTVISSGDGNFSVLAGTHTLGVNFPAPTVYSIPGSLYAVPGPPYVYAGGQCANNTYGNSIWNGTILVPVDFNGDGVPDCVGGLGVVISHLVPQIMKDTDTGVIAGPPGYQPGPGQSMPQPQFLSVADGSGNLIEVSNFNYKLGADANGEGILSAWWDNIMSGLPDVLVIPAGSVIAADVNGDGRQDLIRWNDDPSKNAVFLSRGDGTFQKSTTFNLTSSGDVLMGFTKGANSITTTTTLVGDFTGRGSVELLRLTNGNNKLYVKTDATPPDLLTSVTSSSGAKTTINYMPLGNPATGQYSPDLPAAGTSIYPKMVATPAWYVVSSLTTDTGIGAGKLTTNYAYKGLRGNARGRGMLGFSETRRETYAANGEVLTDVTRYLQEFPYIGSTSRKETLRGSVTQTSASTLKRSVNTYCDQTYSSAASGATETAPCLSGAGIRQPYLSASTESAWDLNGAAFPTTTTSSSINACGSPTSVGVTVSGIGAGGLNQTATSTITNLYVSDNTSGDNWLICKLQRSTIAKFVPDSAGNLSATAGSAPLATSTQGTPGVSTPQPISPAVLSAILSILLDD